MALVIPSRSAAQETVFAGSGGPADLFASAHVEPRVPLAALAARVAVALCPPGAPPAQAPPSAAFRCRFFYDHATDCLTPLAPDTLDQPTALGRAGAARP